MESELINKNLEKVFEKANNITFDKSDKFVIFSDLHLGNGGFNDDFQKNSLLFSYILENYYLEKNYQLILNGDVEDLYKFSLNTIQNKWKSLYKIFDSFLIRTNFYKIIGNHDFELCKNKKIEQNYKIYESLNLKYSNNNIFIYHGHQTAGILEQYNKFANYGVRYIFRNFKNESVPLLNSKKYKTESLAYKFAKEKGIISILGHTHRPLFDSLSKIDSLKFTIESLLRTYQKASPKDKGEIENQIKSVKLELSKAMEVNKDLNERGSIYNDNLVLPCLFNSGAVTGKRGITGIEIKNGSIALVYWFDKNISQRYFQDFRHTEIKNIEGTNFYKAILKREKLDYIFSRIRLLT